MCREYDERMSLPRPCGIRPVVSQRVPRPRSHVRGLESRTCPKRSGGCPRCSSSVSQRWRSAGGVVGFRRLGSRRERRDSTRAAPSRCGRRAHRAGRRRPCVRRNARWRSSTPSSARRPRATLRDAVETARGWLREAFLLQQRLDDAEAHSAAERRQVERAHRRPLPVGARRDRTRRMPRSPLDAAPSEVPAPTCPRSARTPRGSSGGARTPRGRSIGSARASMRARSAPARSAARRAEAALAAATEALDEAERRVEGRQPVEDRLGVVGDRVAQAARDLGEIEGFELELAAAQAAAAEERRGDRGRARRRPQ